MTRFMKMFEYDPIKDPGARLRIDYDPDFGNAILSDENVHPEQIKNPDANHVNVLASIQMTPACTRWIAETMSELAPIMEKQQEEDQVEVDRLRKLRNLNKT